MVKMKRCYKCMSYKRGELFFRDSSKRDALSSRCSQCILEDQKNKGKTDHREKSAIVYMLRDGEKMCFECEESKDVSCFSRDKSKKDGFCWRCKDCARRYNAKPEVIGSKKARESTDESLERRRSWHRLPENKAKASAYNKARYADPGFRAKVKAQRAIPEIAQRTKEQEKIYRIRREYGMSVEDYDAALLLPCANCGRDDVERVMDHDHSRPGTHRAQLCNACNILAGFLEKRGAQMVYDMLAYLASHGSDGFASHGKKSRHPKAMPKQISLF